MWLVWLGGPPGDGWWSLRWPWEKALGLAAIRL